MDAKTSKQCSRLAHRAPDERYGANSYASTAERLGKMAELKGVTSHHDREVVELRADRDLAVEYLKAAMAELDNPEDRGACLLALRTDAEAYGG